MDRYLLATIFLCLLVTLCNARHFRKHTGVSINQTHKDIEKLWGKVEIVDDQGGGGGVSDDPRPRKRLRRKRSKGKKQGNSEVAATKISAVENKAVVSWHVRPVSPKQHDQLPGIYSDYPKPRSRPPSHN